MSKTSTAHIAAQTEKNINLDDAYRFEDYQSRHKRMQGIRKTQDEKSILSHFKAQEFDDLNGFQTERKNGSRIAIIALFILAAWAIVHFTQSFTCANGITFCV